MVWSRSPLIAPPAAIATFALTRSDNAADAGDNVADTTVAPAAADTTAVDTTAVDTVPADTAPANLVTPALGTSPEPTLVASFAADIPSFDAPEGEEVGSVPAQWHGRPSVLPVIAQEPDWLQVRLAQRPNGSTAWVRRSDVTLATTPYRVVIDVATNRLRLYELGEEILDAPVGLGTEDAPTTVGQFFVAFLQEPPNTTSGWGPFVVVTSSHSEAISDFQSSGDAIAAIHGPLGADDEIGETGAKVSHGCVRMHLDDLAALRELPVGTPINVYDSSKRLAADESNDDGVADSTVP